jgi:hypothetical protein
LFLHQKYFQPVVSNHKNLDAVLQPSKNSSLTATKTHAKSSFMVAVTPMKTTLKRSKNARKPARFMKINLNRTFNYQSLKFVQVLMEDKIKSLSRRGLQEKPLNEEKHDLNFSRS